MSKAKLLETVLKQLIIVSLSIGLVACSNDDDGKKRGRKAGDPGAANTTVPEKPDPQSGGLGEDPSKLIPSGDRLISTGNSKNVEPTKNPTNLVSSGSGSLIESNYESSIVSNPYLVGTMYTPQQSSQDSYTELGSSNYRLREVIAPDLNYVHCDPQDRNNPEICPVTYEPIVTGAVDQSLESGEIRFEFTDFANDLVMAQLEVEAKSWDGQFSAELHKGHGSGFVGHEFAASIKSLWVDTYNGSNVARVFVSLQDSNNVVHKVSFEGVIAGQRKRSELKQSALFADDHGYRYKAHLTCLDKMEGHCETSVVSIEQVNKNGQVCNRALAVSRVMDARLTLPDELMSAVNCGTFVGGPEQTRFLTYIANTAHNRNIQIGDLDEAMCTFANAKPKIPHMEYIQARAFAVAKGYAFLQVEGIESNYTWTAPSNYDTAYRAPGYPSNGAAKLFDGARDWFRFSSDLKRDTDWTANHYGAKMTVEGRHMPFEATSGMDHMVNTIAGADLVGNDGRGWVSINIHFTDGTESEVEFRGKPRPYYSPANLRFYP